MAHPPPRPLLSPGTQVGGWRVQAWHAQGAYGAVYRAFRVGQESLGPVALKLSVHPWDARLSREGQLLSGLDHPCIPRLLDRGTLRLADGAEHPWFVMEWIEGTPLYDWAREHAPSQLQLCQVLAHLARGLEAVHASGAVHRDVKGDNVLVRLSDRFPFLIDFGSAHFQGAARLTWQSLAPGTPAYQSPQAALFELRLVRQRDAYYAPAPAEDLYALGVTAYRLVMGDYPPELQPDQDDEGCWRVACPDVGPLLEQNPQVRPVLREWISRLLSEEPEQRGSAALLAQALEAEAAGAPAPAPAAEPPVPVDPTATSERDGPRRSRAHRQPRAVGPWLALVATAAVALVLWNQRSVSGKSVPASSPEQAQAQSPDAGTAAVGDSALPSSTPAPAGQQPLSQEAPSIPGNEQPRRQARPDAKGRCPVAKHVLFNGFCWSEHSPMNTEECVRSGYIALKGKCYAPVLELPEKTVPTSAPGEAR